MAQPPLAEAGPEQVRNYLSHLLIHKHDVAPGSARSIADQWQLGRGCDFRGANMTDFIHIFGEPAGRYIYRSVTEDLYAEWRASIAGILNYGMLAVVGITVVILLVQARRSRSDTTTYRKLDHALFCAPVILVGAIRECMHAFNVIFMIIAVLSGIMTFFAFIRFIEVVSNSRDESAKQAKDK
ncbi:hypothetical protein PHISCL_02645 [Aspergillus sclerotialis]|uniref:Uncharacterized protein n=1 Tax=Aspergillus sclerotialis TaxID=2070753 RepID=A0A3A3A029_9EURO|nr:hypothetical protein PHISCL_02645 [Aspergillus sclerotialis]